MTRPHRSAGAALRLALLVFALGASASFAQTGAPSPSPTPSPPSSPAPAASMPAPLPPTASKREFAQRFVLLQQPSIENLVRNLVESPARQLMAAGDPVLMTKVPPEKRDAAIKTVQTEVRRYVDAATPIVREQAGKLAQTVLVPAVEEKFTDDELRQIVLFLESPTQRKLQLALPELSQTLAAKLVEQTRPQIDPKLRALDAAVAKALGVPTAKTAEKSKPMPAGSGMTPSGSRSTPLGGNAPRPADVAASKP